MCLFNICVDAEFKEASNWKNTRPLLKQFPHQNGRKFDLLEYRSQFIQA